MQMNHRVLMVWRVARTCCTSMHGLPGHLAQDKIRAIILRFGVQWARNAIWYIPCLNVPECVNIKFCLRTLKHRHFIYSTFNPFHCCARQRTRDSCNSTQYGKYDENKIQTRKMTTPTMHGCSVSVSSYSFSLHDVLMLQSHSVCVVRI